MSTLAGAMDGFGTDEEAVQRALRGRSAAEIRAIRGAYREQTGRALDGDLADELSGADLDAARAALAGDRTQQAAIELDQAMRGVGTDEEAVSRVLSGAAPEERRRIAAAYQQRTGETLDAALQGELGGSEAARLSTQGRPVTAAEGPLRPVAAPADAATATATATRTDGAAAPPAPAAPNPAEMRQAAASLFAAMDGLGTNESAIHDALRNRSAAEVAAIREQYQQHYGRTLDGDLGDELSGDDLAQAQAALSGNRADAAAAALVTASNGLGTDEDAIRTTLRGITDPAEMRRVAEAYQRRTGHSLDSMLQDEMSGNDLRVAQALRTGDSAGAAAAELDEAMNGGFLGTGLGTDEDAVYGALERARTPAERQALAAAYQRQTGRTLDGDLRSELSGAEHDVAGALREGDSARAAAARLAVAADGLGTDEDAIFRQLQGRSAGEREAIISAYNQRYGAAAGGRDFNAMIRDEMGDMDAERARQLAERGALDPVFQLRYAMDGLGTDEGMIREALRGRSREEIEQIRQSYRAQYGRELDTDLDDENSGRDGFDIGQMMLGEPRTPEERIERALAAHEFERGSGAGVFGRLTDAFSDSGAVMDRNRDQLLELQTRLRSGHATDEDLRRIEAVADYHRQDTEAYRAAQDGVANGAALAATAIVGTTASILTAGGAAPATAAALSALLGAGAGMAARATILGSSYSTEDIATDTAMAAVTALTAGAVQTSTVQGILNAAVGLAPGATATIGQMTARFALQGAAGGLVSGVAQGAMDERTWRGPGNGLSNFLSVAGTSTLTGAASGAASGYVQGRLDASGLSRGMDPRYYGALAGAASGSAGGVAQTLADPNSYANGFDGFASSLATNVLQNAATEAAEGSHSAAREARARAGAHADESPPALRPAPEAVDSAAPPATSRLSPADIDPAAVAAAAPAVERAAPAASVTAAPETAPAPAPAAQADVARAMVEQAPPAAVGRAIAENPALAQPLVEAQPAVAARAAAADPAAAPIVAGAASGEVESRARSVRRDAPTGDDLVRAVAGGDTDGDTTRTRTAGGDTDADGPARPLFADTLDAEDLAALAELGVDDGTPASAPESAPRPQSVFAPDVDPADAPNARAPAPVDPNATPDDIIAGLADAAPISPAERQRQAAEHAAVVRAAEERARAGLELPTLTEAESARLAALRAQVDAEGSTAPDTAESRARDAEVRRQALQRVEDAQRAQALQHGEAIAQQQTDPALADAARMASVAMSKDERTRATLAALASGEVDMNSPTAGVDTMGPRMRATLDGQALPTLAQLEAELGRPATATERQNLDRLRALQTMSTAHHEGTHRATLPSEAQDRLAGMVPGSPEEQRAYIQLSVGNEASAYGNQIDLADRLRLPAAAPSLSTPDGVDVDAAYRSARDTARSEYEQMRPPPAGASAEDMAAYRRSQDDYARQLAADAIAPLVAQVTPDPDGPSYEDIARGQYELGAATRLRAQTTMPVQAHDVR